MPTITRSSAAALLAAAIVILAGVAARTAPVVAHEFSPAPRSARLKPYATTSVATVQPATPGLEVDPADALIDAGTTIVASGLPPRQAVLIRAVVADARGRTFTSAARFTADDRGRVEVASSKASGSYDGIDAMGLFWSMEPDGVRKPGPDDLRFALGPEPIRYAFELLQNGEVTARAAVTRRTGEAGVRVEAVRAQGLIANVMIPPSEGKHPAILAFGGSEGGLPRTAERARLLASRGYVVLSLAYFNAPGLPATLTRIPVEYFRTALDWLEAQPFVDRDRIGVMSASRGTEMALLLGALFDDVRAIVVVAPQSVIWGGWDTAARRFTGASPWTIKGREIGYMIPPPGCRRSGVGAEMMRCALMSFRQPLPAIPADKIRAPIFLVAGLDDRVSPSDLMVKQIEDRRSHAHVGADDVALYLPHAGHVLPAWPGPALLDFEHYGGNREGCARGFAKEWPALLHFLHAHLGGAE